MCHYNKRLGIVSLMEGWLQNLDSSQGHEQAYPVEAAKYAVLLRSHKEPAFTWWVLSVIKKQAAIILKVKSKYWQRMHKYGICIPKSAQEAKETDLVNGNTLWWDAICKEMDNVHVAFKEYVGLGNAPVGHKQIGCHLIFDVKLGENNRKKARLLAGGYKTEAPALLTYSSVVSRDSVQICLLAAALTDLQVVSCNIQNAYLTAPCREKFFYTAGPEFGSNEGKIMVVTRSLYGLKSASASFRVFPGEHLYDLGYQPTIMADPDVWIRLAVKKDGLEYYEYVLCYVNNVLAILLDPTKTMKGIQSKFKLKDNKIEPSQQLCGCRT